MDNDVDPSATGESKDSKDNDLATEIASLRERLMRALAQTENTRRQGERRVQDAQAAQAARQHRYRSPHQGSWRRQRMRTDRAAW
jgi:molecular chaperone GrpE (heat shock protein)